MPRDPKGLYQTDTRQGLGQGLVSWTWSGPYLLLPLFQGSSVCQVTAIGVTVILLYTSRACYNLFILSFSQNKSVHSFDYDWYNVSDQVSGGAEEVSPDQGPQLTLGILEALVPGPQKIPKSRCPSP